MRARALGTHGQIQGGIGRALCLGTIGQVCLAEIVTVTAGYGGGGSIIRPGYVRPSDPEERREEEEFLAIIMAENTYRQQ